MKNTFKHNFIKVLIFIPVFNYLVLPLSVKSMYSVDLSVASKFKVITMYMIRVIVAYIPNLLCSIFVNGTLLHDIVFYITLYLIPLSMGIGLIKFQKEYMTGE